MEIFEVSKKTLFQFATPIIRPSRDKTPSCNNNNNGNNNNSTKERDLLMPVPPVSLHRGRRRARSSDHASHATRTTTTTTTSTVPISHHHHLRLLFLLISFITAPKQQQPSVSAAFVSSTAAPCITTTTSHYTFSSFAQNHRRRFIQYSYRRRRSRRLPCRHEQQQPTITTRSTFSSSSSSLSSTHQQQELDTTATRTTTAAVLPDDLSSLTVKELRQLVKQQNSQERGLLSRLKRKQDLISYLSVVLLHEHDDEEQDNHNNNINNNSNGEYYSSITSVSSTTKPSELVLPDEALQRPQQTLQNGAAVAAAAAAAAAADTSRRKGAPAKMKVPLNMPPIHSVPPPLVVEEVKQQQQPPDGSSTTRATTMSPKDAIFEKVYQRYPPLRQAAAAAAAAGINGSTASTNTTTAAAAGPTFSSFLASSSSSSSPPLYSVTEDMRQWYHPVFSNLWTSSTAPKEHSNDNKDSDSETCPDHNTASSTSTVNSNMIVNNNSVNNFNLVSSDMDIVFVGTASCTPGVTRGVSCTALRLNWRRKSAIYRNGHMEQIDNFQGGTWLFDVGECTQLQVQRTPSIRPSKITKIFLTHAHGDHSFGLPGLLCLMGRQEQREDSPPVEIYGPEGLRMWLRVAIRYSVSRICPPYRVHEIMNVPMAPEWDFSQRTRRFYYKGNQGRGRRHPQHGRVGQATSSWANPRGLAGEDPINWISQANNMQLEASPLYGEIEGGRQIHPIYNHPLSSDGAPVWEVEDEDDVKVYAAPMSHGVPCLGYVVEELPRPGRLRSDLVEPIVTRNVKALKEAGFPIPMKAMAVIKNLPPGSAFTFPDGTVVTQEEAVEPPRRGRKVVICGDTCDSRALDKLAQDATVVIHESTNAFLQGVDNKDANVHDVTRDAITHGHSTPQIAGKFACRVNAALLVMNHFSARYKGDISVDSLSIMMRIEQQAMKASALNETQVVAAWDLMILPIPQL